jgi:hypothetical protein
VKSRLSDERSDLRPFEGDRCPFRIVLVIAVGVTGGCHYRIEVVAQARQTSERLFTLGLEQPAGLIHAVHADIDSQRSEQPPSARSCRRTRCRMHFPAFPAAQARGGSTPPSPNRRTCASAPYAWWMQVLIVDGANVVGSRPDGWWRDRAGAARRLHERLSVAELPQDEVVLVLEGDARRGHRAGQEGRVRTVHAERSGDDAIVGEVTRQVALGDGRGVIVVTADRMLLNRVETAGASSRGPRWLLDQL